MVSPASKTIGEVSKRRAILVLGMHRSGTSALSGVACALGASPPQTLMPATADNPHGYWESLPLMHINNELLAAAGSSWDDWRQVSPQWYGSPEAEGFRGRFRDLLQSEFGDEPLIMIKDPRLCRLLPFFLSVLEEMGIEPVALLSLRDPMEVALSLHRRDDFLISKSVALWLRHTLEAEHYSRNIPRSIVSYENLLSDWRLEMSNAADRTGIIWPADPEVVAPSIAAFLAPDLRHQKTESRDNDKRPELAFLAAETYRLLCAVSGKGADSALFSEIDALHSRFNEASLFFGPMLQSKQIRAQRARASLVQKSSEVEQQQAVMDQQRAVVDQQAAQIAELGDEISKKERDWNDYLAQHNLSKQEVEKLRDEAKRRLQDELRASASQIESLQASLFESESHRRRLNRQLGEIVRSRDELEERIARQGDRIEEMNREIVAQKNEIDVQNHEVNAQKKNVESLQALLIEGEAQTRAMMAQIEALYLSRSWRMTEPFRALGRFLQRMRH